MIVGMMANAQVMVAESAESFAPRYLTEQKTRTHGRRSPQKIYLAARFMAVFQMGVVGGCPDAKEYLCARVIFVQEFGR